MFKRTAAAAAALFLVCAGPALAEAKLYDNFQSICVAGQGQPAASAFTAWKPISKDIMPPAVAQQLAAINDMKIYGLPGSKGDDWQQMIITGEFTNGGKDIGPACMIVSLASANADMARMTAMIGDAKPIMSKEGISAYFFAKGAGGMTPLDISGLQGAAESGNLVMLMSGSSDSMTMFGYIGFLHMQ